MPGGEILPVSIEKEIVSSYLAYSMSVIIGRSIPDVRDGLKPVQRRVLYTMFEQGVRPTSPYKKSARIVGDAMGKYHPHGDAAIYEALVRMAQDFSLRYPLVDGQGNFGSIDNDPPAAMRYTEVRMARIAMELLADIDKETVDFRPNYDDTEKEPSVLPSRIPNFLINGSSGIAVGMSTNAPPHNLREIIDATIRVIRNPAITVQELMMDEGEFLGVRGPDFPTGGVVYGTSGIRSYFESGRGSIVVRGKTVIESIPGRPERSQIVVTEIPFQVNKAELVQRIAQLSKEKKGEHLDAIAEVRDESSREGIRVVVELKKEANPNVVLNQLYKLTSLQVTFSVVNLAIVNGQPKELGLKQAIEHFISHRREVVTRRTRYELRQAKEAREIVEGLGMATSDIDLIIQTIRESKDPEEAKERLMQIPLRGLEEFLRRAGRPEHEIEAARLKGVYHLSERQAKAILEMRLAKLTGLEREKLAKEYAELSERIARLEAILGDEKVLLEVIVKELQEIRDTYGDDRRTEIVESEGEISIEDVVPNDAMVVTVTHGGYIKRTPLSDYRAQGRGGRGARAAELRDEDFVILLFVANAHDDLLFLTNKGKAYAQKVYALPLASKASIGKHVHNLFELDEGERISAIVRVEEYRDDRYLFTLTKKGIVKRTALSAFSNIRASGIIALQVDEDDELLTARIVDEHSEILIGTAKGRAIRFDVSEVRPMGRTARGVKGIELREGDRVIGMDVIQDPERQEVLCISSNGYGKRTPLMRKGSAPEVESGEQAPEEDGNGEDGIWNWPKRSRGGMGVIAMNVGARQSELVGLRVVYPEDEIMVITSGGTLIRTRVSEIREAGRNTQGVRIMRVPEGERVVAVEPLAEEGAIGAEGEGKKGPIEA
ncbi:MAG: DNA gyrase subunit A [Sandaracinaceae bacterium]|nr:DNA gyrase subunit A [Sandaracinaceae bacterium]